MIHSENQQSVTFTLQAKKRNMLSCRLRCGAKDILSMGRPRVSLYGTRDAAANWEDAHANVLQEYQFGRGVAASLYKATVIGQETRA